MYSVRAARHSAPLHRRSGRGGAGRGSAKALEDLAGMVDGPARVRPRIAEEAALGDEAAVRAVFARIRSRRVVGKCVLSAAAAPDAPAAADAAPGGEAAQVNPVPGAG